MDWAAARTRFAFLAEALEGGGGFSPRVTWAQVPVTNDANEVTGYRWEPSLSGPTHLVRYQRETELKFAARNAVATYENHMASAVERFVGFLGRRMPQRSGVDAPLTQLMIQNADLRGTPLDAFWRAFSVQAKARGSMLLVMDTPTGAPATSLADQIERRRVPYVRWAPPESIEKFKIDPESGLFLSVTLCATEEVDGEDTKVERDYDTTSWRVRKGDQVLREGVHNFGACPVLAFTEDGSEFPKVGTYAQVADLSKRIFNARSEQDEILRSQTFSLLTLHVPPDLAASFDARKVTATIGTHSLLIHSGDTPAFISPDAGPAQVYSAKLEELQQAIRRITKEESTESATQAESGVARRLRFEALNAEVSKFAQQLQALELRVWSLWRRAVSGASAVEVTWPTDYNLADIAAELDILALMQAGGMPPEVLNEKRKAIVHAEFDSAPDEVKAALEAAIDQYEQEPPSNPGGANDNNGGI